MPAQGGSFSWPVPDVHMILFLLLLFGSITLVVLGRLLVFRGPHRVPQEEAPTGILDMHCHTAGIGAGGSGAWISDELRNSWKFGLYLRVFGTSKAELEEKGDAHVMAVIARSIRESVHVDGAVIEGRLGRKSGAAIYAYDENGQMN